MEEQIPDQLSNELNIFDPITDQDYWDLCLIQVWRKFGNIGEAVFLFQEYTGKWIYDLNLKRAPTKGIPWKVGMRAFVGKWLIKISNWLWDHPANQDQILLNKLRRSNYDVDKKAKQDSSLAKIKKQIKNNESKLELAKDLYLKRK